MAIATDTQVDPKLKWGLLLRGKEVERGEEVEGTGGNGRDESRRWKRRGREEGKGWEGGLCPHDLFARRSSVYALTPLAYIAARSMTA